MSDHPSFLALDRAALANRPPHCDDCAAHQAAVRSTPPLSRVLIDRALQPPPRLWLPRLSLAVGALSVLVLVVTLRPPLTTTKAGSSVSVFIKRGNETALWNGEQAVRVGDRIQLVIEPNGRHHVSVLDGEGKRLYEGMLGDGPTSLPLSWRVEGEGTQERLIVILSEPGSERLELSLPKELAP